MLEKQDPMTLDYMHFTVSQQTPLGMYDTLHLPKLYYVLL